MPMYEFRCADCGNRFEELVFSSNYLPEEIICPACNSVNSEKLISAAAISTGGSNQSGTSSDYCSSGSGFN